MDIKPFPREVKKFAIPVLPTNTFAWSLSHKLVIHTEFIAIIAMTVPEKFCLRFSLLSKCLCHAILDSLILSISDWTRSSIICSISAVFLSFLATTSSSISFFTFLLSAFICSICLSFCDICTFRF